mmetsp:Transcript_46864/g.120753  ORF Transcript_46864/g.120753 Transcript_46864/m.120753 type:complete len:460 (-) Transcript_46864:3558-4937(-)
MTLEAVRGKKVEGRALPPFSALSVTVPGAAGAWASTVRRYGSGKLTLGDVLSPAISLAEKGVPVGPITAASWSKGKRQLLLSGDSAQAMLTRDGRTPSVGEVMRNQHLANTMRELAEKGEKGFYEGAIADAIVRKVEENGGIMSQDDLASHTTDDAHPVFVEYMGRRLWELPPNGQGLVALIALNILKYTPIHETEFLSADALHYQIESLRLAFADAAAFIGDPGHMTVSVKELLSDEYAKKRARLLHRNEVCQAVSGSPFACSDTVYFSVVDKDGNACSFINSNYMGFGTGLIPEGCGFTLQNRGANFVLDEGHPNVIGPCKRPYHTIIPGLITDESNNFVASFGVMGGFMQPQGHLQVFLAMVLWGKDPQEALDAPRFCIGPGHEGFEGDVAIEEGMPAEAVDSLLKRGHSLRSNIRGEERSLFGRGQVIVRDISTGVLWAGSDGRADGCAMPAVDF